MRFSTSIRSLLLASSTLALAAACSDAEVKSPGATGPVTVITNPGGGGGSNFANRSSRPRTAGDCPVGTEYDSAFTLPDAQVTSICKLEGNLTGPRNIAFTSDPIALVGSVFIGDGTAPASIQFAPGQVIFGASAVDALVISRNAQINANGSPTSPIVFTSFNDLADDGFPNGTTGPGEWGGLVINGRAPINDCTVDTAATPGSADCLKAGEAGTGIYGGDQPNDNSGILRYVRVQHTGFLFNSTNELNGIAFQGVGDGTTVEYVQVHQTADDGFEWFGGTVNGRYLVTTGAGDDSFDWTDGWNGDAQFLLAIQDSEFGNRGIEADNREGAPDQLPRSNPTISNITLVGRNDTSENDGIKLRRGTDATLVNGVVTGFGQDGFDFDQDSLLATPTVDSFLFSDNTPNVEANAASQAIIAAGGSNQTADSGSLINGYFPGPVEVGVTPTDPQTLSGFFAAAPYAGAFDPVNETPTNNWATGWTVGLGGAASCPDGTIQSDTAVPSGRPEARICRLLSPIIGDVELPAGNLYQVVGSTFIGQDLGPDPLNPAPGGAAGTLTISPGVTLFGNNGPDVLVVSRGSQIFANGTATAPIVMTSRQDVFGLATGASQWGGLAINGRARLNDCTVDTGATPGSIACEKSGEGSVGNYGGVTDDDNSGRLRYLRVQYSGFLFNSTNELNGISFHSVGNGTEVEYVQVHQTADDGFEWYGGTVDGKYLIATGAGDDSFDWTDGWTGRVQFAIALQDPTTGNRGIEADNREFFPDQGPPRSSPLLANFTLFGRRAGGENDGVKLRRGTAGELYNFIITNFLPEGADFDADSLIEIPAFHTSLVIDSEGPAADGAAISNGVFANGLRGNADKAATPRTMTAAPGFTATIVPGVEEDIPATNALSAIDPFFDDVTYIGAVEDASDDWYKGWTIGL